RIGQELVPHVIRLFTHRNPNIFFSGLEIVEQAKLNTGGVLGKNGEVDAITHPCRTERIRITEKGPNRSHKRAPHLSCIASPLAIIYDGVMFFIANSRNTEASAQCKPHPSSR